MRTVAFGIVLLGAAAWLRFHDLAVRELWLDENCTFYCVNNLHDWPGDGPDRRLELIHVPYYWLLRAWTGWFGMGTVGLRSFSAFVGTLTVLLIGFTAWRIAGHHAGLIAAAIAAVHPLHIHYSQEARVYAFWMLEVTGMVLLLYLAAKTNRWGYWVAYGIGAMLTVWTHTYTLFWLPATIAIFIIATHWRSCLHRWLVTHAAMALLSAIPFWLYVIPQLQRGPKGWLAETWHNYPPLTAVPRSLWSMLPSSGYPRYLGPLSAVGTTASQRLFEGAGALSQWGPSFILGILLVIVVANRSTAVDSRSRSDGTPIQQFWARGVEWKSFLWLSLTPLLFLFIAWLYSWLVSPSYIIARYDFAAWPAIVLAVSLLVNLAASSIAMSPGIQNGFRWVATIFLVGCSSLTVAAVRLSPIQNEFAERARRIAAFVRQDDLVISMGMYRWFMTYQWHQLDFQPTVISFPPCQDRQLCWDDPQAELHDPAAIEAEVAVVMRRIEAELDSGRTVWLLAQGEVKGARWEVDQHFFAKLRQREIHIELRDEEVGLALLTSNKN